MSESLTTKVLELVSNLGVHSSITCCINLLVWLGVLQHNTWGKILVLLGMHHASKHPVGYVM